MASIHTIMIAHTILALSLDYKPVIECTVMASRKLMQIIIS